MTLAKPAQSGEPPFIIFLPGLGEREAEDLEPFQAVLRVIPLTYWDWREWIKPGCEFQDLIASLKKQIQRVSPRRPLCLVGYSIGGPLAYACALEIQQEGGIVDCVAILDGSSKPGRTTLKKHLENLLTFEVRSGLATIVAKALVHKSALPLLRQLGRRSLLHLPFAFSTYLEPKLRTKMMWRTFVTWWSARSSANPPLSTPVVVFRSGEHQFPEEYDLGWGRYCSNVSVVAVAGDHNSMLAPENLGPVCEALARIYRDCQVN